MLANQSVTVNQRLRKVCAMWSHCDCVGVVVMDCDSVDPRGSSVV